MTHPADLRRAQRRKMADTLWEHLHSNVKRRDFEQLQDKLLAATTLGSAEAIAIGQVTWAEVRDDIETRWRQTRSTIHTNLVSCRHAANVAGVDFSDFAEAMGKRGVKGIVLERREIRAVLATVFSRTDDPEVKESIKAAIHVFADEPGT